jgi:FkbM family methyltransferase
MTNSNIYITMQDWIELVKKQGTFTVETIMEIGSMNGYDADELAHYFKPSNVFIFEAHPVFAEAIEKVFPEYHVHNFAACNFDGEVEFNAVTINSENLGMSSLLPREDAYPSYDIEYSVLTVDAIRLDTFCSLKEIKSIDLLKIDVEGNSYEVLQGFGDMIWNVKCIHVECEHTPVWKGQKLYTDVEQYLIGKGFIPVSIRIGFPQSDSVWVKKEFYNGNWFNV